MKWPFYEHVNHSNELLEVLCNVAHSVYKINLDFINISKFSHYRRVSKNR